MTVRDPVCGMCLEWEEARAFQRVGDAVVYFCCPGCATRFDEDPDRYLEP
nr:YHS domain-containing protein [Gemmatimonadota bacterium]NIU73537.1 YHS domain-containing protein [Gammaproteobacteria bacterium]NIY07933.1 YHS domain-containing protein [Gemmatimonadota bacterium]